MKLLFDQNLSFKLCQNLSDLFPDSSQARLLGLAESDDRTLWQHARNHGFIFVTQDSDFADLAMLFGPPPKIIWLRCGNQPTAIIENALRNHASEIGAFEKDPSAACLEIY